MDDDDQQQAARPCPQQAERDRQWRKRRDGEGRYLDRIGRPAVDTRTAAEIKSRPMGKAEQDGGQAQFRQRANSSMP